MDGKTKREELKRVPTRKLLQASSGLAESIAARPLLLPKPNNDANELPLRDYDPMGNFLSSKYRALAQACAVVRRNLVSECNGMYRHRIVEAYVSKPKAVGRMVRERDPRPTIALLLTSYRPKGSSCSSCQRLQIARDP